MVPHWPRTTPPSHNLHPLCASPQRTSRRTTPHRLRHRVYKRRRPSLTGTPSIRNYHGVHSRSRVVFRPSKGVVLRLFCPLFLTRLLRTIFPYFPFVFLFRQPRHLPFHHHTSLLHHLPTWFPSLLSQTLTHYAYLLISDILYDTQTRCGRPFPGLSCI